MVAFLLSHGKPLVWTFAAGPTWQGSPCSAALTSRSALRFKEKMGTHRSMSRPDLTWGERVGAWDGSNAPCWSLPRADGGVLGVPPSGGPIRLKPGLANAPFLRTSKAWIRCRPARRPPARHFSATFLLTSPSPFVIPPLPNHTCGKSWQNNGIRSMHRQAVCGCASRVRAAVPLLLQSQPK